jgi:hypothetical protein
MPASPTRALQQDSVPNVRFCACRTIMWMSLGTTGTSIAEELGPVGTPKRSRFDPDLRMEHHSLGTQNINTIIKPCLSELVPQDAGERQDEELRQRLNIMIYHVFFRQTI